MNSTGMITVALLSLIVGGTASSLVRDVRADPTGPFEIVAQNSSGNAWVLDSRTGDLRLCLPPLQTKTAPECWPWSGAGQ